MASMAAEHMMNATIIKCNIKANELNKQKEKSPGKIMSEA
jgi:hypothetical protein